MDKKKRTPRPLTLKLEGPDNLEAIFPAYQVHAIDIVSENGGDGANSRSVWEEANRRLGEKSISRASVINFLDDMVERGMFGFVDATGKGGYHRVYKPKMTREELDEHLISLFVLKLDAVFPDSRIDLSLSLPDLGDVRAH